MGDKHPRLAWVLSVIKDFFTKNILLKIASLVFAVTIWAAIISIDNPTRRLPLADVDVRPVNYTSLESKNLAITAGEASLHLEVDAIAEVAQSTLRLISSSKVSAYVDLNDINEIGEQELTIKGTIPGYASALTFSPAVIKVNVEHLASKLVPVSINEQGVLPDGFRIGEKVASPNRVTVKGPASVVDSIARAVVDIPLDSLTNTVNDSFTYRLLDNEGQEVPTEALVMTDYSVIVFAPIEPKEEKTVVIPGDKIIGELPEGYHIKSIEVYPQTLQVSAPKDALDSIESIEPVFIDVDGKTESFTVMVDIQQLNGVTWMQAEQLSVQVNIAEDEETKLFTDLEIEIVNFDGKAITFDGDQRVRVEITAARSIVRRLLTEDIEVFVNLASYEYGEYDVPIEVHLPGQTASAITATPATLHVDIRPLTAAE